MSRHKIKNSKQKNTTNKKPLVISATASLRADLAIKRYTNRTEDATKIGDMIAKGSFDPYKISDYRYLLTVARSMEWSVGRLQNAIETASVAEVLKREQSEKNQ